MARPDQSGVGLPPRVFLYTIDQLSVLLHMTEATLHAQHVYHEGRDITLPERDQMRARNIASSKAPADWRVEEKEFIRWMKVKGFKYYNRGTITS